MDYRQITTDFKQKFEGTWVNVRLDDQKKPELFFMRRVDATPEAPLLTLVNSTHGTINLSYNTEYEISFPFPQVGYFFYQNKVALMFQRLPARKFKRAICQENSRISTPYDAWLMLWLPFNEDILKAAFNPNYLGLNDAEHLVKSGKALSVPLSQHLALGASPSARETGLIIWFHSKPVGTYSNGTIRVRETHFHQEIVDYVKERGCDAQVI